jgi:ABC-2 type transport system ATP-binding protein
LNGVNAIEVRGLRKAYGDRVAVAGIDLHVARGEVFALLGPNGAGKTTTVEILEGHRERTSGEVSVLGYDPQRMEREFKERIGVVLQETGVEPYLSVRETLDMYRGYYPKPLTTDHMLELVGLKEQAETRVIRLSGGQQRRLDVAIGLAGDPELLFLDEPTTGFDPAARRGAWEMVRGLQDLGKTIFLTTHYMEEAEYLADRVAIIRKGEIVAEGPPSSLVGADPATTVRFRLPDDASDVIAGIEGARVDEGLVAIETLSPTTLLYELTRRAQERGVELPELTVMRPSLEDTYLRLVGVDEPADEQPAPRPMRGRRGRR